MGEHFPFPNIPWLNDGVDALGLGDIFQGIFQSNGNWDGPFIPHPHPMQNAANAQNEGSNRGAPPASSKAIRQLPTIRVTAEDLVEPSNRECCICLDENCLGDKVTRLPCAHIFHEECILDWLTNHHCTCPVCRYELPTNDPSYESGRVERMRTRKPRFALYELKRMSIPELLALNRRPAQPGIVEKNDIIEMLIREERIHLVPSPEPVEYELKTLKEMRISELKSVMADAGVFFRTQDVVEKEDMITIFLNSGRLNVLQPSGTGDNATTNEMNSMESKLGVVEESKSERNILPAKRPMVETVLEDSDDEGDVKLEASLPPQQEMFGNSTITDRLSKSQENAEPDLCEKDGSGFQEDIIHQDGSYSVPMDEHEGLPGKSQESVDPSLDLDSNKDTEPEIQNSSTASCRESQESFASSRSSSDSQYNSQQPCQFQECTILHLQDLARINNIDVSSCFERSEMVDLLVNAGAAMQHPSEILRESLSRFGVSELRVLASEVNIDLSQCNSKEEMLNVIVQEAMTEQRPHLQNYLRALAPLATLSLSELRGTARDWNVNINDCLEKSEIMQRLITRRRREGI